MMRTIVITLGLMLFIANAAEARTWRVTGQRAIQGDFVDVAGNNVQIRIKNGAIEEVPFTQLSKADQTLVKSSLQSRGQPEEAARLGRLTKESGSTGSSAETAPEPATSGAASGGHKWRDVNGNILVGQLVRVEGPNVVIRVNGVERSFPIQGLSVADQTFINQQQQGVGSGQQMASSGGTDTFETGSGGSTVQITPSGAAMPQNGAFGSTGAADMEAGMEFAGAAGPAGMFAPGASMPNMTTPSTIPGSSQYPGMNVAGVPMAVPGSSQYPGMNGTGAPMTMPGSSQYPGMNGTGGPMTNPGSGSSSTTFFGTGQDGSTGMMSESMPDMSSRPNNLGPPAASYDPQPQSVPGYPGFSVFEDSLKCEHCGATFTESDGLKEGDSCPRCSGGSSDTSSTRTRFAPSRNVMRGVGALVALVIGGLGWMVKKIIGS